MWIIRPKSGGSRIALYSNHYEAGRITFFKWVGDGILNIKSNSQLNLYYYINS